MLISRCPSCDESITVPAAPRESRVRCPLCQDQYLIGDVLDNAPPLLELLDAPAAATVSSAAPLTEGQSAPAAFAFGEAPAPAGQPAAFEFDSSSATTTSTTATKSPIRRPRRKARNPIIEVVKIVGGGVAGLFIAQMILWWLPFDLHVNQRDPIQIGRNLSTYVPWIMPADVRGDEPEPSDDGVGANDDGQNDGSSNDAGVSDDSPFAPANLERDKRRIQNDSRTTNNNPSQPGQSPSADASDGATGEPDSSSNSDGNSDSSPFAPSPPTTPTTPPEPPATKPGLKLAGIRSVADLHAAIAKARNANMAYDDAPSPERANEMYLAMAELAEALTYVDNTKIGQIVPALKSLNVLLRELEPRKYDGIAALAAAWHESEDRSSDGIVLVGKIQRIEPLEGDYYQSTIELGDAAKTVSVLGWIPPPKPFKTGARVLILGSIVDNPAAHLNAYSGDEEQTICGAYSLVIEPAQTNSQSGNGGTTDASPDE